MCTSASPEVWSPPGTPKPSAPCSVVPAAVARLALAVTSTSLSFFPMAGRAAAQVLRHEGQLAEMFLNTRADLRKAFAESRVTRRATALFLYADSVLLSDPDGYAELLRVEARSLLAADEQLSIPVDQGAARHLMWRAAPSVSPSVYSCRSVGLAPVGGPSV